MVIIMVVKICENVLLWVSIPHFQAHPERFPWGRAMVILASQTMIDHDDPLLTTMVTILDCHHCNVKNHGG